MVETKQVCLGSPGAQMSLDSQGAQESLGSQVFLSMFLHSPHLEKLWVSYNCFLLCSGVHIWGHERELGMCVGALV